MGENAGTEPKLWIDKYSINQTEIEQSLACLPVYLAGCQKLLILCGTTYLKRLWCLVEIFVFIQMGGNLENLEVILLDDSLVSTSTSVPRSSLHSTCLDEQIRTFDPREARCCEDYDTERLHAVLGAGGYEEMLTLVQKVFCRHSNA